MSASPHAESHFYSAIQCPLERILLTPHLPQIETQLNCSIIPSTTPPPLNCPTIPFYTLLHQAEVVIDVRTPAEFEKGSVVDSINFPLFDGKERAELGILYKQTGKQQAIARGHDILTPRLEDFFSQFQPYVSQQLLIYCARGGMRSGAVVQALCQRGFRVQQLPNGYKGYRGFLLHQFQHHLPAHWIVLRGATGCGKTDLLQQLPNALDLEHLASHRGSVFGALDSTTQCTQKTFEARLWHAIAQLDPSQSIWVEGESRWIGKVCIPAELWQKMQQAPSVRVHASLEKRVERIVDAYAPNHQLSQAQYAQSLAALHQALSALTSVLGKTAVNSLQQGLKEADFKRIAHYLLVYHYDPRYAHAMRAMQHQVSICAEQFEAAIMGLKQFANTVKTD